MKLSIPFIGQSYQARSSNVDAQRTLNCFVELDESNGRAPLALYGTPGLRKVLTLPTYPVRGGIAEAGYAWVVAGSVVYRIAQDFTYTVVGSVNTSSGQVGIASNGSQLIVVDGTNGYIVTVATSSLAQITDDAFPNGVKRAAYDDGYFLVTGDGSQKFYISEILDGGAWDGLDFASAEGSPDNTVGVIVAHREVWLFGNNSAEVWFNTGNASFPFERSGNTFIEQGCAAAGTIAKMDSTVFWLGGTEAGAGVVWRANGYNPQRISTHAIEYAISQYGDISDAFALIYQQEGHWFYILTFPTAGKTWAYDVASQMWHERNYRKPSTGVESQWRPSCHMMLGDLHLVGDWQDGRMYVLDMDYFTDDGDNILRLRVAATQEQLQNRLFFQDLQIDMRTGVGLSTGATATLMLRYSNDGGNTWSNTKTTSVGFSGEYSSRARFHRLGMGRNRSWEISMTDPVRFVVIGAIVDATSGTS